MRVSGGHMDLEQTTGTGGAVSKGPAVVEAALAGPSDAELDARPADGGWTARETAHHIADSEITSAIRLRRLIAEDEPAIIGYDGNVFAQRLYYSDRPVGGGTGGDRGGAGWHGRDPGPPDRGRVGAQGHPRRAPVVRRLRVAGDLRRALPRARRPDPRRAGRGRVNGSPSALSVGAPRSAARAPRHLA